MAMGNTTVDPKNMAGIGCSIITVNRERNKGLESKENGPKLSVKQGEEILEIGLSSEKYRVNESGEVIGQNGEKTGSIMSAQQQNRFAEYTKTINSKKKELSSKGFEH